MLRYLLIFNIALFLLLTWYTKTYLLSEQLLVNYYSTQLSYEQIEELLGKQQKWAWLGYVTIPVFYLIKLSLITSCLYTGVFLLRGRAIGFLNIFEATTKADMIFLVPAVMKMVWFTFQQDYSIQDLQFFLPGSLLNLVIPSALPPWAVYPLQAINIYEIGFWLILAYELKDCFKTTFTQAFQTVALSYGIPFVVWIVGIVFLTVTIAA